jgi:hypothetical protein
MRWRAIRSSTKCLLPIIAKATKAPRKIAKEHASDKLPVAGFNEVAKVSVFGTLRANLDDLVEH